MTHTHTHTTKTPVFSYRRTMATTFAFLFLNVLIQAQTFPPPSSCTSKDLELVSAKLLSVDPCFNCVIGDTVTNTLQLAINNKTGSTRTSFAFWGTLVELNSDGTQFRERPISACVGPVPRNAITSFNSIQVGYKCGKTLKIKNLYLAWTDASNKNTCAVLTADVSKINPKCGTLPEIAVQAGVDMSYTSVQESCTNKGSATLTIFGGAAPYTVTVNNETKSVAVAFGTITFSNLAAGTYAVVLKDKNNCLANRNVVISADKPNPLVPEVAGATSCLADVPAGGLNATILSQQEGASYTWYDAAVGGNVVASPNLSAVGDATYYAEASIGECKSASRSEAKLNIKQTPGAPSAGTDPNECEANPIQTLKASATTNDGASVVWYEISTGGSALPTEPTLAKVDTVIYYAEAELDGCVSTTRTPVTLTIRKTPAIPLSGGNQYACEALSLQTLKATASAEIGATINWYNEEGGLLSGGAEPTLSYVGVLTYKAEAELNGCKSFEKTPVTLEILDTPEAPSDAKGGTACQGDLVDPLEATAKVGEDVSLKWYTAMAGGALVANPEKSSVGSVTYYAEAVKTYTRASQPYNCASFTRTAATLNVKKTPDNPLSGGDQSSCDDERDGALIAGATGDGITWYDAAEDGNVVLSPELNSSGEVTYYAEAVLDGCVSLERTAVKLTISATPATPEICVVQPSLCGPAKGSVTILSPTGTDYGYSIDGGLSYSASPEFSDLAGGVVTGIQVKSDKGCVSVAVDCDDSDCTKNTPNKPLTRVEAPQPVKEVVELVSDNAATSEKAEDLFAPVSAGQEEAVKVIPNPFADQVRFVVNVPKAGHLLLEVFDVRGQKVATVFDGYAAEGISQFEFQSSLRQNAHLIYIARTGNKMLGKGKLMQVK